MSQGSKIDSETERRLIEHARHAATNAYAPYSNFPVGAAVLTADGQVFEGCNVECAAFPNSICAEGTAVTSAVVAGHRDLVAIAIVTPTAEPTPPCGGCRQFLAEFGRDLLVIYVADSGGGRDTVRRAPLATLLPERFEGTALTDRDPPVQ